VTWRNSIIPCENSLADATDPITLKEKKRRGGLLLGVAEFTPRGLGRKSLFP
jgi:hypothetical protein